MKFNKMFKKLCAPAQVYLAVSVFMVMLMLIQNLLNYNLQELCVGPVKCNFPNVVFFFLMKALYIGFWTFILNFICKLGYKSVSWFVVLLPFILFGFSIVMLFLSGGLPTMKINVKEAIENYTDMDSVDYNKSNETGVDVTEEGIPWAQ